MLPKHIGTHLSRTREILEKVMSHLSLRSGVLWHRGNVFFGSACLLSFRRFELEGGALPLPPSRRGIGVIHLMDMSTSQFMERLNTPSRLSASVSLSHLPSWFSTAFAGAKRRRSPNTSILYEVRCARKLDCVVLPTEMHVTNA